MTPCPICELQSEMKGPAGLTFLIECKRCGTYRMDRGAIDDLSNKPPAKRMILSFFVRLRVDSSPKPAPHITYKDYESANKNFVQPTPDEQADQLLLRISHSQDAGSSVSILLEEYQSAASATKLDTVVFLLQAMKGEGLVTVGGSFTNTDGTTTWPTTLTFVGWRKVHDLKILNKNSKTAFIAMQFGDSELEDFLNNNIRGFVAETGYRLLKLNDEPKAGLIDAKMQLDIQSARFLLADLSHGNKGAYWEAGYAEGLGKPVIYLCKQSNWDEAKTHFDTNHRTTVMWDVNDPVTFGSDLKAAIRFTIPEAKREDS